MRKREVTSSPFIEREREREWWNMMEERQTYRDRDRDREIESD